MKKEKFKELDIAENRWITIENILQRTKTNKVDQPFLLVLIK